MKAITLCVNRFEEETKTAFLDLYSKIDAKVNAPETPVVEAPKADQEIPF